MSTNFKNLFRGVSLLALLVSLIPAYHTAIAATTSVPPVDMFQLPWDQGLAWYAIDGIDNGSKRPTSSSHNYTVGGAIDFAPRTDLKTGDNTSSFWVAAAAAGTVIEISSCHMKILHSDGWLTEYQFLGNIQVKLGDMVSRNQHLGIIADGVKYKYCSGSVEPNVPHVHFMLRPTLVGATLAGWQINYSSFWNSTTFTKNGTTVGLRSLLLNAPGSTSTATPVASTATAVPTGITPTPTGPYVSTEVNPANIGIGITSLATVRLNNVPASGYTSAEFTCSYLVNLVQISNIAAAGLFGNDSAVAINDPQNGTFVVAIAGSNGNKATTSGIAFTFDAKALQAGQALILCDVRINTGNNVLTQLPSIGAILTILADTPTPTLVPTTVASSTPVIVSSPTSPVDDWLTFLDSTYAFEFKYPPQSTIESDSTDSHSIIFLPFVVPGTNLGSKYLEMVVAENADPCQSPLATQSGLETSETVIINGISFLKQTGEDATAGHINKWVAYTTLRNNACVSLDFIMRIANPGAFATPPPLVDEAAESVVFGQIVSTYVWLTSTSTAAPTLTFTPVGPTPTFTFIPTLSPMPSATQTFIPGGSPIPTTTTPTPPPDDQGIINGVVLASKSVTITLSDLSNTSVRFINANPDGTFGFSALAGTYRLAASADGFLSAERTITIIAGNTDVMPTIALLAGDIDNNNVIDQFDALTIGMSYNMTVPASADLNNDGIINVLDLERLAQNYRQTGPVSW